MKQYAKAIVGALVAGFTALGTALSDDRISQAEGVGAVVAFLTALGLVWAVPNEPAE